MGPRADENLRGHGAVAAEAGGPHDDAPGRSPNVPSRWRALGQVLRVLAVSLLVVYTHGPGGRQLQLGLAAAASLNSLVSLGMYAQDPVAAFSYYHLSFVLLFAAVLAMLYAV